MKALSVRQPWAHLIVTFGKDIENRTWSSRYRGPLLIHAGVAMNRNEYEWASAFCMSMTPPIFLPANKSLRRGGFVGKCRMVGCVTHSPSPWFFGPHGFVFSDQEPIEFVPAKGKLGFFDVEGV